MYSDTHTHTVTVTVAFVSPAQHHVVCPTERVEAEEAANVTLHCRVDPPTDLQGSTIELSRADLHPEVYVHIYRHRRDDPGPQAESYRGRTRLQHEGLREGSFTLTISPLQLNDTGKYTLKVLNIPAQATFQLAVGKLLLTLRHRRRRYCSSKQPRDLSSETVRPGRHHETESTATPLLEEVTELNNTGEYCRLIRWLPHPSEVSSPE